MIRTTANFTGLEIDLTQTRRKKFHPIPVDWTRHQFSCNSTGLRHLDSWMSKYTIGNWTVHRTNKIGGITVVLGFENEDDAVMFRLKDAEKFLNSFGEF